MNKYKIEILPHKHEQREGMLYEQLIDALAARIAKQEVTI